MKIEKLSQDLVGRKVTCTIQGITILDAKIQCKDGLYFVVQNAKKGCGCEDKLGYKYSWAAGTGSPSRLSLNKVKDLKLIEPSLKDSSVYKGLTLEHATLSDKPVVEVYNDIIFYGPESSLLVGTYKALHKLGYKVKEEMTLEQVCKELGRNIKIKE